MAKKKEPGKALVKWDEQLASLAEETTKGITLAAGGKFISFAQGKMSVNGIDIDDDELECVVVGMVHHNTLYDPDERYDPKNPQSPLCYAYGTSEEEMEPSDESADKKSDSCAGCPFNEYGSSGKSNAKACKNLYRIALIAASDLDDIENAEVLYANIPPTSKKLLSAYTLNEVKGKLKRPIWSVVTLLKRVPDELSQFRVTFKFVENITDGEKLQALMDLWSGTMDTIDVPYQKHESKPVKQTKKKFTRR